MTAISDRARRQAIQIEVKKDRMAQRQSGEWAITFVLHPQEMPPELMNAKPGTRYTVALVETGDNGEPVERPANNKRKEVMRLDNGASEAGFGKPAEVRADEKSGRAHDTPPRPAHGDNPKLTGADKRSWNELGPAQQAGIRCNERPFWTFLNETRGYFVDSEELAAEAVREICCIKTRAALESVQGARVIWHQLDTEYRVWKEHPELVA